MKNKNLFYGIVAALFILGGILSPGLLALVPFSLVCFALLVRDKFSSKNTTIRLCIMILSGLIVEFFSWFGSYITKSENPALFHPLLVPDMLLGLGYYTGLAIGWTIADRHFGFNMREVFFLSAIYGVFMEQMGAIFLTFNPIAWIYVGLVYTSMVTPGFLLVPPNKPKVAAWKRYLAALVIVTIGVFIGTQISGTLFGSFIPPKPMVAGI